MKTVSLLALLSVFGMVLAVPAGAGEESEEALDQRHLEKLLEIIGEGAVVAPELRTRLLEGESGLRVYEDTDGDGDPDLMTFRDDDPRHTEGPIVVRVIDDDDDMAQGGEPDIDSDCYVADWKGDGMVDRVVDFWDEDGDNDVDRQDIHYRRGLWHTDSLCLIVIRDIGDDDKVWYTRNYQYDQPGCQWLTDFNGDEIFTMFYYDWDLGTFVPLFEDPFSHYDTDGDRLAEITVRVNGTKAEEVRTLRYSYDVDNDTNWLNRRDYDFSFNCTGPAHIPAEFLTQRETLRNGLVCEPYIPWDKVRPAMESLPWKSNRLCWDEIDNNVNVLHDFERFHERWEGVGGYPMKEGNKRWETDADYSGGMQLYYSPVDRRIHLLGAEEAYLHADYDFDGQNDAILGYADKDGDGYFDAWTYDADADGTVDRTYTADPQPVPVPHRYPQLTAVYLPALEEALQQNQALIDAMKAALGEEARSLTEKWYVDERPDAFYAPGKLLWSREATRYYQDLIREELFTHLLAAIDSGNVAVDKARLESLYAEGRFADAASLLTEEQGSDWFGAGGAHFTKRIALTVKNPVGTDQPQAPVVVGLAEIQRVAKDFNPACFAVVDARKEIIHRQFASQADDLDGDGTADELSFVVDLHDQESRECFLYYTPEGTWSGEYSKQVDTRDGIAEVGTGWESELIGFRTYYGKGDFYAKKIEGLNLADLGSYHDEADWGMDVLHVGPSPGLGGLTLWSGDQPFRAYNEADLERAQISQTVVSSGPVRAIISIDIKGLEVDGKSCDIAMLSSTYASQMYSENRVTVTGAAPSAISAGLVSFEGDDVRYDAETGVLTSWGLQDPVIGTIGQAVIPARSGQTKHVSTDISEELQVPLDEDGKTTFYATGEWIKCRGDQRRIVAKSAEEWLLLARRLARRVQNAPEVQIGLLATR